MVTKVTKPAVSNIAPTTALGEVINFQHMESCQPKAFAVAKNSKDPWEDLQLLAKAGVGLEAPLISIVFQYVFFRSTV